MDASEKIEKWSRKRNADEPKDKLEWAVHMDVSHFNGMADFRKLEGKARSDFADEWIKMRKIEEDFASFAQRADALKPSQRKEAKAILAECDRYIERLEDSDPALFKKMRRGLGQTYIFLDSVAKGKKGSVIG